MNGPQLDPQSPGAAPPPVTSPPPTSDAPPKPEQAPISAYDPRYKSPLVASVLSVFPGVGQVYVGYYRLGFTHAIVVAGLITLLASRMSNNFRPLLAMFMVFFWLYNIIDAGRRAALYNHALRMGESFDVPSTPSLPGGGSLAGGVALIAIGGMFLMHTAFDYSLEWIADWWPMAPILFGCYLVYRWMEDRATARATGRE